MTVWEKELITMTTNCFWLGSYNAFYYYLWLITNELKCFLNVCDVRETCRPDSTKILQMSILKYTGIKRLLYVILLYMVIYLDFCLPSICYYNLHIDIIWVLSYIKKLETKKIRNT